MKPDLAHEEGERSRSVVALLKVSDSRRRVSGPSRADLLTKNVAIYQIHCGAIVIQKGRRCTSRERLGRDARVASSPFLLLQRESVSLRLSTQAVYYSK